MACFAGVVAMCAAMGCPSDQTMHRLIHGFSSEDPQRVLPAQPYTQPGGYACGTPQIDQMVDIASAGPGVWPWGADRRGLPGRGCIMVLARKEAVDPVRKALVKHFYRPAHLQPAILPCIAVEGAGLAES